MKLLFSKRFIKSLKKQPKKIQNETKLRLQLFLKDPFHILLKRHALKGKLQNFESMNVSGDIRHPERVITSRIIVCSVFP
jgi:mRNA-degrading endonuclease YafQ of YafQ-DinJ toxin-antitoxin module